MPGNGDLAQHLRLARCDLARFAFQTAGEDERAIPEFARFSGSRLKRQPVASDDYVMDILKDRIARFWCLFDEPRSARLKTCANYFGH